MVSGVRALPLPMIIKSFENAYLLKSNPDFEKYIVGFDLVSEEDKQPVSYFKESLEKSEK